VRDVALAFREHEVAAGVAHDEDVLGPDAVEDRIARMARERRPSPDVA
jgi:hypothetical protein